MTGSFSENLRKLREEKGLSQKQLGKQTFVNNSTVARRENGTLLPDDALDARKTEAGGFMVKPLTPESVKEQLNQLRYPYSSGGSSV